MHRRRREGGYMDVPTTDDELDYMLEDLNTVISGNNIVELGYINELSTPHTGSLTLDDSSEEDNFLLPKALPSTSRHPWQGKNLMWYNFSAVAIYWFGWSFVYLALIVAIIPKQLENMIGIEQRDKQQGIVLSIGSITSLILSPLFGIFSDHSNSPYGRRRPFILAGSVLCVIGLIVMASSPPFPFYCLGFSLFCSGNYIILAPYAALVPDVIPADQRGVASGYLGGFSLLGCLAAGVISYNLESLGFVSSYLILILVTIISGLITVRYVPEVQSAKRYNDTFCFNLCNLCSAFKSPDFAWVFASRFCIQLGIITVQENLQAYLKDTVSPDQYVLNDIRVANSEVEAASFLLAPLLLGGVLSSIIAGVLSDLWGIRKGLLYFSGITMAIVCFLFGVNNSFLVDVLLALSFGFGFGVFSAIDWAIATDVLPDPEDFAKDMGVWNLAFTAPQMISAPLVGWILDTFRQMDRIRTGWFIVFFFISLSLMLGTYLVKFIQHVK